MQKLWGVTYKKILVSANMKDEICRKTMAEKIQQLEDRVGELESALILARTASLDATLGPLRLREIALLYIGEKDESSVTEQLREDLGYDVASQALRHLFFLSSAPLQEEQRQAVRIAFNHGIHKW